MKNEARQQIIQCIHTHSTTVVGKVAFFVSEKRYFSFILMVFCLGWLWKLFRGSNFDSNSFFSDAFFRFRHLSAQSGTRSHMQAKKIIGELKLETPKTKYFSPFSFIQSAARRFENKNKIIRRFKNFFVFFFCLVRCRYCLLKKNIDFTVAPSIIIMS